MAARIYTRAGDDGSTGLADGKRLPKHDLRVATYGTVDETSSVIGVAIASGTDDRTREMLVAIQNDLFDLGADLAVPDPDTEGAIRVSAAYVQRLEGWIDEVSAELTPLENFVLPGGSLSAAQLHQARTVCRRAERQLAELATIESERVNEHALQYANRLSDLLFVLARRANDGGRSDVTWRPGGGAGGA